MPHAALLIFVAQLVRTGKRPAGLEMKSHSAKFHTKGFASAVSKATPQGTDTLYRDPLH